MNLLNLSGELICLSKRQMKVVLNMLGAIIGDIVGSRFEWNNHRDKEF